MKHLLMICMLVLGGPALAQDDWSEEVQMLRPECQHETPSAAGLHMLGPRKIGSQETAAIKARGVKKVPVVLVAFPDKAFTVADNDEGVREYYRKFCNGTMDGHIYTGHGSHGSIRDYFVEQSDSVFFPQFEIIGPVTLSNGYAYYGQNSGNTKDVNYSKFTSESLAKAVEVYADWTQFDNDGDNSIDMVFFLFAGMGENFSGAPTDLIWPKETKRSETINGQVFATNAVTCELRPKSKNEDGTFVTQPDGVGVFIHELSHALGLPDFYDINYVNFGMDLWSVMDYGEYGNNGFNPGNYTAYERDFMGWRPLQELKEPCVLTIPCFAAGGYGYKIQNDASSNEYYIIENRQAMGWDDKVCTRGHGLQVTHVDFDASLWNNNRVNTVGTRQRMTIIAANDRYIGTNLIDQVAEENGTKSSDEWKKTLSGNLFPGDTYKYDLTDESSPAATVYTGGLLHKPLRNITENADKTITLCFMTNGQLDAPVLSEAENVMMDQFDIEWSSTDNATRYAFELYRDSIVIRQDTIAETQVHIDGLMPSSDLKFRVRAMADMPEDYVDSEWSDFAYFSTLADFIDDVPESDKLVDIYASNGMLVSRSYADELHRLSLRRGIYILRYSNGACRKVMIR